MSDLMSELRWHDKLLLTRREKELSQRDLAKLAKTNHVQISRIEQGEQMPKADMLYRICKALDISMDYVFNNFVIYDTKESSKST